MEKDVDIPASKTVVVVNGGSGGRFHRQPTLPWREFACSIEATAEVERVPRLRAEQRDYEPCLRPDCFGVPE